MFQKSVVVRVRPFTGEENVNPRRIVSAPSSDRILIVNPNSFHADPDTIATAAVLTNCSDWAKSFKFSSCFWSLENNSTTLLPKGVDYSSQEDIYRGIGEALVGDALDGVSSTTFAYGHTGTGKTYTMFGDCAQSAEEEEECLLGAEAGLIPRVFTEIVNSLDPDLHRLTISFLEIYNDKLRDLLSDSNEEEVQLRVREHPSLGTYVENLAKVEVRSPNEVLETLRRGVERRATSSTNRNSLSSRSHAMVSLEITSLQEDCDEEEEKDEEEEREEALPKTAIENYFTDVALAPQRSCIRVQMVDLAGSEKDFSSSDPSESSSASSGMHGSPKKGSSQKLSSSRADESLERKEMKFIRKSLSNLGYILNAMSKGASPKGLPFRDSVLTWLLKDALTGEKCHTMMISTISPSHLCYDETLSSLKYAQRLSIAAGSKAFENSGGLKVSWAEILGSTTGAIDTQKLHQDLGANRPGTEASRVLLAHTVNDPRQRLAKLSSAFSTPVAKESRSLLQQEVPATEPNFNSTFDLRDSYRALKGQVLKYALGSQYILMRLFFIHRIWSYRLSWRLLGLTEMHSSVRCRVSMTRVMGILYCRPDEGLVTEYQVSVGNKIRMSFVPR